MSSPLSHVNATLARHQLRTLDERLARNRRHVAWLGQALAGVEGIDPIGWPEQADPAFWVWLVRCAQRDRVLAELKQQGIQCAKLHQPNDVYTGFGSPRRPLAQTDRFMAGILALPCGWWLTEAALVSVADGVRRCAGRR
jgi:dTDP-4-amino-4,6-dideoxygalactose transaminase